MGAENGWTSLMYYTGFARNFTVASMIIVGLAWAANAETRVQKTFGSWIVSCVQPDGADKNSCVLSQSFQQNAATDQQPVFAFSWSVGQGEDGIERAVLRAPLLVDLSKDISVNASGIAPKIVAFRQCTGQICLAMTEFKDNWSAVFANSDSVDVQYTLLNGAEIQIAIDLDGFPDAYAFFEDSTAN